MLDLLAARGKISDKVRASFAREGITTLRRLINTPEARERLGLKVDRDARRIEFLYPEDEVLKGLAHVADDIAHGRTDSRELDKKADRLRYVEGLPKRVKPDPKKALPAPVFVPPVPAPAPSAAAPVARHRAGSKERSTVAPKRHGLNVTDKRLQRIVRELGELDAVRYTNAVCVLFRVFVELSLDDFIDRERISVQQKPNHRPRLKEKMEAVATAMEAGYLLDAQELRAVRNSISSDYLATSVTTFHDWVHNLKLNPSAHQAILAWDNLEPLFKKLWP